MNHRSSRVALIFLAGVALLSAQSTIPPGTGVNHSTVGGFDGDDSYALIASSVDGEIPAGLPSVAARARLIPITQQGSGWFVPTSGKWIGPDATQNNVARTAICCGGVSTYELQFNVTSSSQSFRMLFCADDSLSILLNGVYLYSEADLIFASPCQHLDVASGFQLGKNVLHFNVTNINGPTGLYVSFSALSTQSNTPKFGPTTFVSDRHLDVLAEPVDSGTGQYYESDSDFELGGPMNFGFRRYYGSQLTGVSTISTPLGLNWMSNFDSFASVIGTAAQVSLTKGLIVSFTNAGGAWQLVSPLDIVYQFIQSGTNYQLLDPQSNRIYTFSSTGALTSIADRNGNAITLTQGANGPTLISDGLGRTLTLAYTGTNLTKITDQAARSVAYTYNGSLLASSTNYFNQTTKYTYTGSGSAIGLMTTKQLPLGNSPTTQTYDGQGRVLTQKIVPGTDGTVYTSVVSYDGNGGTTVTDGLGKVTKHVNDGTGNIMQITDAAGAIAIIAYDGSNRRSSVTDKLGNKTSYTYYAATGLLASTSDALSNVTSTTFAPQSAGGFTFYDVTGIAYADGTSISRTVDAHGNVLSETSRSGAVTKSTYDAKGRIVSLTSPNQSVSTMTWNADSTMASYTDSLGNKRTYAYDNSKRMTSTVNPAGGTTSFVLDKSTTGPMTAINTPINGESAAIYDDQNLQLQDVVNSTGGVYHSDYTTTGQLAAYTDPMKHKTTYTYDGDDRVSTVTNSSGEKVTYVYDSVSRVTSVSDANGPRLAYTYTPESRVATVADGSGRKTSYTYDALGRLTTVGTPGGNTLKTGYDKSGLVTSMTDPLGGVTNFTLDAAGAIKSIAMPGGIATSVARDANEAITSIVSANGNTWSLARDANERLTKVTDPLGRSSSLTYTGVLATGATLPLGTVAITNDGDGRVTKQAFSDGTTFSTTYDSNGALSGTDGVTIKRDAMGQATNINGIGITQDGEGRPLTLTYAAGKTITYGYDSSGLLTSITDWVGGKTTLNYDGSGILTSFTFPNGVTSTETFDGDGVLSKIAIGNLASISLTRDAAGKITAADRNLPIVPALAASSQQLSYDAAGQLTNATYDTMGRVTSQNGRTYGWNLASQLTSFKDGVNAATLTYDGFGEISSSTVSGAAQNFVFNYLSDLPSLSIVRQASNDLRYYVYLPSGLLLYSVEAADNSRHFYHFDEMGNTAFLTGDKGTVTDSYAITPYGEIAAHIGTTDNPFVWQGEVGTMQVGQGLYYMRDRYYDSATARFISPDPEMTLNPLASEPYAYAGGNPMLYIDPYGSNFLTAIWDGIGAVVNSGKNAVIAAATAAKNAVIAAATAARNALAALAALANKPVEPAKKAVLPPAPAAPPRMQPSPPAKAPVVNAKLVPPAQAVVPVILVPSIPPPSGTTTPSKATLPKVAVAASLTQCTQLCVVFDALGYPRIIGHDGAGVVANDGGTLISQDGSNVISNDGGTVMVGNQLFTNVHGTLISQDGSNFQIRIGPNGIIGENSNGIIGENSNGLLGTSANTFKPSGS